MDSKRPKNEGSGHYLERKPGVFRDIGKEILELLADSYPEMPLEDVKNEIEKGFQGTTVWLRLGAQGAMRMHIEFLYFDGCLYPLDFTFPLDQSWDKRYLDKLLKHEIKRGKYAFGPSREEILRQRYEAKRRKKAIARLMKEYGISAGYARDVLDGVSIIP